MGGKEEKGKDARLPGEERKTFAAVCLLLSRGANPPWPSQIVALLNTMSDRGVRAFGLSLGERRLDLGVSLELERGACLSRAVHPFLSSLCQSVGGGSSSGARFSHRVRDPVGTLGTLVGTLAVGEVSGHRWVRSFRGVSSPAVSIGA